MEHIKQKLGLPDVSQVGMVVRDMDSAIQYYEKILGMGPFVVPDIIYTEKFYYGKLVESGCRLGFCSLGPVELELIQPTIPPTIHHDHLKEKGEGLHHLGFDVKNIDEKIDLCKKLGIKIIQSGRGETSRFAYLDTLEGAGVIIELIQRKGRRA